MNKFNLTGLRLPALLAAAACLLLLGPNASAQMMRKMKFQELVQKSDHIFTAKCIERKTSFQNGRIVTHYKLKPDEQLKGTLKLNKKGELEMEEVGGKLTGPVPVGTFVPGMADIAQEEEVLLFAQKSKPVETDGPTVKAAALMEGNLVITGRSQGRFSVLRNPESGEKLITRIGRGTNTPAEDYKLAMQRTLARVQSSQPAAGASGAKTPAEAGRAQQQQLVTELQYGQQRAKLFEKLKAQSAAVAAMSRSKDDPEAIVEFESLEAVRARIQKVK